MNANSKYKVPVFAPEYSSGPIDRRTKLTAQQKSEIQRKRWEGVPATELAAEYGVSRWTIYRCPAWDGKL